MAGPLIRRAARHLLPSIEQVSFRFGLVEFEIVFRPSGARVNDPAVACRPSRFAAVPCRPRQHGVIDMKAVVGHRHRRRKGAHQRPTGCILERCCSGMSGDDSGIKSFACGPGQVTTMRSKPGYRDPSSACTDQPWPSCTKGDSRAQVVVETIAQRPTERAHSGGAHPWRRVPNVGSK